MNALVAYFSASGTTAKAAKTLAKAVADSEAYKWLREHAPEYLYSKFY